MKPHFQQSLKSQWAINERSSCELILEPSPLIPPVKEALVPLGDSLYMVASGWASSYSRNCLPKYTSDQSGLRHRERTFRFPGFPLKFRWKTFSWGNYASENFFGHFKIGASEAGVLKRESCDCRLLWTIYGFENPRIWNMRKIWLKGCRPKCRDMKR